MQNIYICHAVHRHGFRGISTPVHEFPSNQCLMSAPGQGGGRRRCGASATDDNAVLGWTTMADCSRIQASRYQVLSRGHHCKSRRSAVYTDDCKSLPNIPTHERRIPGILRQILSLVDISYHKMSSPATSISQSVPAVAAPSVPEASPCPPLSTALPFPPRPCRQVPLNPAHDRARIPA